MLEGSTFSRTTLAFALVAVAGAAGCSPAESSNTADYRILPAGDGLGADGVSEANLHAPPSEEKVELSLTLPLAPEPKIVPAGASMTFRVDQSLSTESNRAGDRFSGALVSDLVSTEGGIVIPSGARASGVVAVAQESTSADDPAVLELRLESLEVGGIRHNVSATIVATEVRRETRDSGRETAAKIGAGTAAGAIVGGLIGRDRRGALIGAGAGAVAGTAVAVTTDDGHARIDAGSAVTAVLEEPLQIE